MSQNDHTFALFDPPQNGSHSMTPWRTTFSNACASICATGSVGWGSCRERTPHPATVVTGIVGEICIPRYILQTLGSPVTSHRQDYYIFSKGSQPKPSFATLTGKGDNPENIWIKHISNKNTMNQPKKKLKVNFWIKEHGNMFFWTLNWKTKKQVIQKGRSSSSKKHSDSTWTKRVEENSLQMGGYLSSKNHGHEKWVYL